jgi:hypothetical protein
VPPAVSTVSGTFASATGAIPENVGFAVDRVGCGAFIRVTMCIMRPLTFAGNGWKADCLFLI